MVENLVIIGSGPAGYTAAIYAGRAQLKTLVFEGFCVGGIPGGQLMTTTEVENYPGFSEGVQGPKLMQQMRQQALRWGAMLITDDVIAVDFTQYPFAIAPLICWKLKLALSSSVREPLLKDCICPVRRSSGITVSLPVLSAMGQILYLRMQKLLWLVAGIRLLRKLCT